MGIGVPHLLNFKGAGVFLIPAERIGTDQSGLPFRHVHQVRPFRSCVSGYHFTGATRPGLFARKDCIGIGQLYCL